MVSEVVVSEAMVSEAAVSEAVSRSRRFSSQVLVKWTSERRASGGKRFSVELETVH